MGLLHCLLVGLPIVGGLAISAALFPSVALWFGKAPRRRPLIPAFVSGRPAGADDKNTLF